MSASLTEFPAALVNRYFSAVDLRDETALKRCFEDTARAIYHKGRDSEITLIGAVAIANFLLKRLSTYECTTHALANVRADVKLDCACLTINAVANCVSNDRVFVRGLRYQDELAKVGGRWVIRSRIHVPLWQYEAVRVAPAIPQA